MSEDATAVLTLADIRVREGPREQGVEGRVALASMLTSVLSRLRGIDACPLA